MSDLAKAPALKLRVGLGSFIVEAADEDSRWTIVVLGAVLAILVAALITLAWRLTRELSIAVSKVTGALSSTGSEGAKAIDLLAKAVFAVAAAIVLMMLAALLIGVFSLFGSSGQKSSATASVLPPPAISVAPLGDRDSALFATAIEALARAAEAGHAGHGSDQQLLAGLAGAGVGMAIGVLAALLYGASSRAQPRTDRVVLPVPIPAPTPPPKPSPEGESSAS